MSIGVLLLSIGVLLLSIGVVVLCMGYSSCIWDTSLVFWSRKYPCFPGCDYGEVYCLAKGCQSCQRMLVLSKYVSLVKVCLSSPKVPKSCT